jgi:hypothetical protein
MVLTPILQETRIIASNNTQMKPDVNRYLLYFARILQNNATFAVYAQFTGVKALASSSDAPCFSVLPCP